MISLKEILLTAILLMSLKWHFLVQVTREIIHNHHFLFFITHNLNVLFSMYSFFLKWTCTLDTDTIKQSSLEMESKCFTGRSKTIFHCPLVGRRKEIPFQITQDNTFLTVPGIQLQIIFRYLSFNQVLSKIDWYL